MESVLRARSVAIYFPFICSIHLHELLSIEAASDAGIEHALACKSYDIFCTQFQLLVTLTVIEGAR